MNVGVLMRSFARTSDPVKVQATADRVITALKDLAWYKGENWRVSNILVLVPGDQRYKDSDAGHLARRIRIDWTMFTDEEGIGVPEAEVEIMEVALGDLFVGLQNLAANIFAAKGCDVMITLAPSAFRYFDEKTADDMMQAFAKGARISGVAIPEDGIDEFVNRGTLGGPIAAWKLKSLIAAGGFDPVAAQAFAGEENPRAGVEEIIPLVHLVKTWGPCVAPIQTRAIVERRQLEGEDLARHQKQIATKTERQLAHARSLGIEGLEFFANGVIPEYRVQPVE